MPHLPHLRTGRSQPTSRHPLTPQQCRGPFRAQVQLGRVTTRSPQVVTLDLVRCRDLAHRALGTTPSLPVVLVRCRDLAHRAQRVRPDSVHVLVALAALVVLVAQVVPVAQVVLVVQVGSPHVLVVPPALVVLVALRVPVAQVPQVGSLAVQALAVAVTPLAHSVRAVSQVRVARASVRSGKSGTTCKRPRLGCQSLAGKGRQSASLVAHR
jgi:hypothetical protein